MPYAPNRHVLCPSCKKEFVTSNRNIWAPLCGECLAKGKRQAQKDTDKEKYFEDCPICGKHYRAKMKGKRHILCNECRKIVTICDVHALSMKYKQIIASSKRDFFEKMRVIALEYLKEKYGTESLLEIKEIVENKKTASVEQWLKTRKILECPRLRVKMETLPCGKREECFGATRCPNCPTKAYPPSGVDLWDSAYAYSI